jgi:putative redox protein
MLEVLVNHLGDVQFEVKARNHTIYCDQPAEHGGFDEGMTPPEFFLASMGACAGYYAVQYLKAHGLPMEGLQIRTTAEKASGPARISAINVTLDYPESLEPRDRDGLCQAVQKCVIHNTLLYPPKIEIKIRAAAPDSIAA